MDRKVVRCVDCNQLTDPKERGCYWESHGWIEYRAGAGGANNMRFRTPTGRVLCPKCGEKRVTGKKGQDSLF